jgi:hypothetical protein
VQIFDLPDPAVRPASLGFSQDGRWLAVWEVTRIDVVDPSAGTVRNILHQAEPDRYMRGRNPAVGFTPDGRGVIAHYIFGSEDEGSLGGIVRVFDAATGEVGRELPVDSSSAVEIGPGGKWVYAGVFDNPRIGVLRWNPLTGETLPAFGWSRRDLYHIAVSADERVVAAAVWDGVRAWRFRGQRLPGRATKQLQAEPAFMVRAIAMTADGRYVAAAADNSDRNRVDAWEVETGERWAVLERPGGYRRGRDVAFHPARPVLAYCASAEEVAFYDAKARAELKRFEWGIGTVSSVAFSHDGLRCAAAGKGKVVVWDVDA